MNILKCQTKNILTKTFKSKLIDRTNMCFHTINKAINSKGNKSLSILNKNLFSENNNTKEDRNSDMCEFRPKIVKDIPQRYMPISVTQKKVFMEADFPCCYFFQREFLFKILGRKIDFLINLEMGEFFFIKNFLLLLIEVSHLNIMNKNFYVNNVIICDHEKQLEFFEKIINSSIFSSQGVVKNLDDLLFDTNLEKIIPKTLVMTKNNFVKFVEKFDYKNIFSEKCLFFLYKINTDDEGKQYFRKI